MNSLTNEQIARVFAMYLGCDVYDDYDNDIKVLYAVTCDSVVYLLRNVQHKRTFPELKLIITPLSAISDEDAIEVAKIYYGGSNEEYDLAKVGRKLLDKLYRGSNVWWCFRFISIYLYLIQRGYAVPLFIAPNHPDNGKTAIELGLAIDKTREVNVI